MNDAKHALSNVEGNTKFGTKILSKSFVDFVSFVVSMSFVKCRFYDG